MPCWKQPRGTPSYCPSSSRSEPRRCPCDGRAPAAHGRVRPAHLMTSAAAGSGGRSARPWALQRTGVRVHVHAHSNWAAQGCGARGRIARRAIKRDSGTETCQARRRHGGGASASGAARLATNSPLPSALALAHVRLGRSFLSPSTSTRSPNVLHASRYTYAMHAMLSMLLLALGWAHLFVLAAAELYVRPAIWTPLRLFTTA
jgi:hypothetical protein